ncbi:DUF6545 domain-containing protein [Mycobacterium haemophilum]|uniref:DUF6545 domain-containing protein n=1 Tax=Mycobacterium haemophilum TaxID=29311 RepID=UPI0006998234|nr:DUF6545 domain-containing protein [Mycobacterium haemophilum]
MQAFVLALTELLGWAMTSAYRLRVHGPNFVYEAGACVIGAVPVAMKLLAFYGLDPVSRTWSKLQPLQQTTLQLHHTVVEIRDAILQLRPYVRDLTSQELGQFLNANSVPAAQRDVATSALYLAHTARAKTAGVTPEPLDVALMVASRATTLDEESTELLKLAKWWPVAYAVAEQSAPSDPTVKVSPSP